MSFLAGSGDETLLIDPLLEGPGDPVWELIDSEAGATVRVLITIPYHVRSAEDVRERLGKGAEVTIHGHPKCATRLKSKKGFHPIDAPAELPGGITAHRIGKPVRFETPFHIPELDAVVFGDAIAGTKDGPRIWSADPVDAKVKAFYGDRFVPTLDPLLELDFERLLMTHGPSVMKGGRDALADALSRPPWYPRGD